MASFRFKQPPGPLAWAVCFSVLLHSGLLAIHVSSGDDHGRRGGARRALGVRLVHAQAPAPFMATTMEVAVSAQAEAALPAETETVAEGAPDAGSSAEIMAPAGPTPEPVYFDAKDLSERPRFANELLLTPDDEARVAQLGEVDVEFLVSDEGGVDHVSVSGEKVSETDSQWLAALLARMQLVPGRLGSEPVRSRWHIRIAPESAGPVPAA